MAQQGTEEKTDSTGDDESGQGSPTEESAGKHAASGESGSSEESAGSEQKTEQSEASAEKQTEKSEQKSEQPTQEAAAADAPTERHESPARGQGDTSWAEPEHTGSARHRSVDIGELAWRTGNVLATVVRTLALLFALVLIVNVVLVLVGVNPANGVAQFVGAVADIVILGFRDLFVPADPTVMVIVNSLIAAVFWAFVGELLSRLIRYLAARVK